MALNQKFWFSTRRILRIHGNSVELACNYGKHYNPKFRTLRRKKFEVMKYDIDLPQKEEEIYKKKLYGLVPSSYTSNIPYYLRSSYQTIDPYVPTQGDGSYSSIIAKASDKITSFTSEKSKNFINTRKVKKYDGDFSYEDFAHQAKEIYINAHEALASKNVNELLKYATEKAFNLMVQNYKDKTIKWKYIESLDPPKTVHVRTGDLVEKGSTYAQVTVRLHSKQMLAIYDRFGRLMYGSEILAKDVLEYVVFEKHLVNVYGRWRLHSKIIPDWVPPTDPLPRTHHQLPDKTADEVIDEEFNLRSDILPESEEDEVPKQ